MKKNELYIYIPLSFALLLPVPGRFAYGLIIVFLLYLMSVCGILFKKFAVKFFNAELSNVIVTIMLVSLCILVRQLVIVFSPLIAFVLGIAFFMPAFTSFILGNLYSSSSLSVLFELKNVFVKCSFFCVFALVFFFIRDVFGYGTISFPSPNGIFEIQIFSAENKIFLFSFLASIPGAVVLLLLFNALFFKIISSFEIIETSRVD